MALDQKKLKKALPQLEKEKNIWLSTVRKDGRPHLIPIWFIWHEEMIWIATGRKTQKVINIQHNNRVAASLEDGSSPVIIEGTAALADEHRSDLAPFFMKKYDWDFRTDADDDWALIAITPNKLLSW